MLTEAQAYRILEEDIKRSASWYTYIPETDIIPEYGHFRMNGVVELLRKYKNNPDAIQFIADMLEE